MARGLAEIVATHGLSELIVDTKETTLTVRRGGSAMPMAMPMQMQMPMPMQMPTLQRPRRLPAAAAAAAAARAVDDKSHVVTSPFVGTFYRKPNPDSPNYVSLNDKVDKGAGALHRRGDEADERDRSRRRRHGDRNPRRGRRPVEYGQPLFKIAV